MSRVRSMLLGALIAPLTLLLASSSVHAQAARAALTMGSGTGTPGTILTLPVTLTNPVRPVAGLQFSVIDTPNVADIDTVLVAGQAQTAGFQLAFNRVSGVKTTVLLFSFNNPPPSLPRGLALLIVQIKLRIRPNAPSGSILLRLENVVLSDSTAQKIPTDSHNGLVLVTGGAPPSDTAPPAAPQGLSVLPDNRRMSVQWAANTEGDLAYYVLHRSLTNGFTPAATDSIARILRFQTAYTDTGLTNGTPYYYKLIAVDFAGNHSAPSAQASGIPDVPPTITSLLPPVGPAAGGIPVVIGGTNFKNGAAVTIGGVASDSVAVLASTRLVVRLPPGTPGQKDVTVINPGGTRGTLSRGFTYIKVDSVTVSLTVTANVAGTARTDTVHTARLPEGLPFITPQKTAPVAALQRLFDALAGLALEIPPGAIDQNITVGLDVRNVTIRNDSTIFAPINGKPSFLFIHPAVSVNGVVQTGFDFSGRAAINLTVLLRKFGRILQASGVDTTAADTLALAYVTPSGLTQEGMISKSRHDDRLIIASLTTLADLAGVRQRDLTANTAPPAIVSGPFVVPSDTFATVTWRTDKLTTSRVEFGTGQTLTALTQAVTDTQLVNGHVVVLGNLARQTKYYYRVISEDDRGQRVASRILFFSTVNRPDVRPPTLTVEPQVLALAPHNAVIGWITDELSTSTVEYGPTAALGTIRTHDALVIRHVIALHGLEQSTTYSALVSSADGSGNVTAYPDTLIFTTSAAPDTLPPRLLSRPVVAGLTPTSALIQWTTDTPSDSRVTYVAVGTADTLQAVNTEEPLAQQHSVTLTGLTPNTPYLYVVRSTDQEGNPVASRAGRFKTPGTVDTTPPVIVRGPAVLYASDTVIAIGWVTDEASDGFVYYKGSSDSTFTSHGVPAQSRRHIVVIGGLTSGETYTFALTSTDPSGNTTVFPPGTVLSKPVAQARPVVISASGSTFTTASAPDAQPPVITGGPRVVARTSTSITISWETDEPGNSQVWYGTNLSQQATDTDLVTAHQVTLTNLSAGTTYPYQVGSTDPAGNGPTWSAQSAATTATTADTEPPVILSGTVRTAVSNDRVTVSWETDEPSDSFVQYGTAPTALTSMVGEADLVTAHTAVLTNLSPNQAYSIRATSTDLAGNGPTATTALNVTTTATADTARPVVSGVQASAVATTDTSVTLTVAWQTDRLATSVVEYGTTSGLGSSVTNATTGTVHQVVIPRLSLNTQYFFRAGSASATDPQGSRLAYSTTSSLTTPATADTTTPAAPATVTAIPGDGAAYLRWTPSPSASGTGYTILRNGNTLAIVGRDSSFLDVSATNGQAQSYTIRAISAIGKTGALSASASATPNSNQVPTAPAANSPASGDTISLAPVLVIGNAAPVTGDPARAALTYGFQVGADSAFSTLVASVVGIAQGVSSNPTHWKVEDTGLPGVSLLQSGVRYWWRGRASDGIFNGAWSTPRTLIASASKPTGITPGNSPVPRQFALRQNYPNPFNPATAIRYDLPRAAQVTLRVYNLLGQEVAVLVDARQEPGYYTVRWDGRNRAGVPVASGLYFYRLRAGEFIKTKKMMLVR